MTEDKGKIAAKYHEDNYRDPLENLKNQRVAVYMRTAVASPDQVSSIELLKKHYTDFIEEYEGWSLVGMYIDKGVGGSHAKDNPDLQRMLSDARNGMFDLIITRNISRFARNIVDIISIVRELSTLNPPIGFYFEEQNEYIIAEKSQADIILNILSIAAQDESRWKAMHMTLEQNSRLRYGYCDTINKKIWGLE